MSSRTWCFNSRRERYSGRVAHRAAVEEPGEADEQQRPAEQRDRGEGLAEAQRPVTSSGVSVPEAATMPAKPTPHRLSPTIRPVAVSTPIRRANSGLARPSAHLS